MHQFPGRARPGSREGIRPAQAKDLRRCVALINRTHRGHDLFRPYTTDELEMKLDGSYWGPKPRDARHVYDWRDYYVVEEDGRIVACGGLWDRGANIRERWRHKTTGEQRTVSATALLDFGYERGHEAAMSRLIGSFISETHRLQRDYLIAPLQQLPKLAAALEAFRPQQETRALGWFLWDEVGRDITPPDPPITRPYTDLAYW